MRQQDHEEIWEGRKDKEKQKKEGESSLVFPESCDRGPTHRAQEDANKGGWGRVKTGGDSSEKRKKSGTQMANRSPRGGYREQKNNEPNPKTKKHNTPPKTPKRHNPPPKPTQTPPLMTVEEKNERGAGSGTGEPS